MAENAANKILIGADRSAPLYSFATENPKEVKRLSCVLSSALSGDELAIDQLLPTVYSEVILRVPFVPSGSSGLITSDGKLFSVYPGDLPLERLPYGTPIWYYSNNALMGKFYLKRALRSGKFWVDITAVSAIGILDGQTHYGGIYTGQKFRDVAADIIGGAVSFSCVSSGQSKSYSVILPAGRMRGDVDGDGKFTDDDQNTIKSVVMGEMTRDDFDTQSWDACDVNADGTVNYPDVSKSRNLVSGSIKAGSVGPEVTGNWTNNPNYATDTAQFYTDISVSGVTASDTASITVTGTFDKVDRVECLDGTARVYVTLCPIEDVPCTVTINRASGSGDAASENQDVGDIQIYGWLPVDTRRNNLHQLLFSCGVTVTKDADGNMVFGFPDTETIKDVPDSRIFLGGNVDYMTPATRVEVTEHAFMRLPSDTTVTLYDNTDGTGAADHTLIIFQEAPVYDLQVSGSLRIIESGVNYAVGSGTGVLTGRKYTHTTKIISRESDASGDQKTVSVTDVTLVNVANSSNVAKRVLSYYASAKTIAADIKVDGEKPGDQISFSNPFGEPETAFLSSMDINASSFLRAACELVTGYAPVGQGNNYTHVAVLTGSGTWEHSGTVRAVLISGGEGGWSGCDATEGTHSWDKMGTPGTGGVPGQHGRGGRILSVTLEINGSIAYACGIGGVGGANNGETSNPGEDGTDTTFGAYTTADGERSQSGTVNLFSGEVLALDGLDGLAGGDGASQDSEGGTVTAYNGVKYIPGAKGADKTESGYGTGYGGYGGGPAVGSNGGDGKNGGSSSLNGVIQNMHGGPGGKGADAEAPPDASKYGCGGNGGHGGGGGGQGGYCTGKDREYGNQGAPGAGSDGSRGGDGCIILYYR